MLEREPGIRTAQPKYRFPLSRSGRRVDGCGGSADSGGRPRSATYGWRGARRSRQLRHESGRMRKSRDRSERILVKYPLFQTAVARMQACFDSHEATVEPDCCPIVGESGGGKTTIVSYFASLHPRVDHKSGLEVPVLVAKVPARPTVKSFAETLLYQMGDPLWSRGNTVSKSIRLRE